MPSTRLALTLVAGTASLALAAPANAGIFGTDPIPISVTGNGGDANASSGGAAVSGDDRKGRFAGFHSDASNLVAGDTNGASDVFLWQRPRGRAGLTLTGNARPAGAFQRVSVGPGGRQANGASLNPSIDGSVQRGAKCVAFQSQATNLAAADRTGDWDVYVRNFASRKTLLVSKGVANATMPSIDGSCRQVAFEAANGKVYIGTVGGGVRSLGAGRDPDFSLDGSAVAWERGGSVVLSRFGRKSVVGPGANPQVSDAERLQGKSSSVWGVVFDSGAGLTGRDRNPGSDVYMRVFGPKGGARRTDLISASFRGGPSLGGDSYNGGITAYAPNRGILTFVTTVGGMSTMYYRNNNSGNIDDLAHVPSLDGKPAITGVVTSARANFIAFSAGHSGTFELTRRGRRGLPDLGDLDLAPARQDVFFKHLIDGEAI